MSDIIMYRYARVHAALLVGLIIAGASMPIGSAYEGPDPARGTGAYDTSEGSAWTADGHIGDPSTSQYWDTGQVNAGFAMYVVFTQSGFGADAFQGRLHRLTADGCVFEANVDWNPTGYVLELRTPEAHGGSYQVAAVISHGTG